MVSPDNVDVIDLTSPSAAPAEGKDNNHNENDDNSYSASLSGVRKRLSSPTPSVSVKSTKKVKIKAANTSKKGNVVNNDDDDDDDDIVVLDPLEVNTLFCAPVSTATSTGTTTQTSGGDGDDIELVGTKNHVLLPHMRQHCTEKAFQGNTGYSSAARKAINSQFCSHCYCYICDVPVSECTAWDVHCQATDQGVMARSWKDKRQQAKRKRNAATAATTPAATTAMLDNAAARIAERLSHPAPPRAAQSAMSALAAAAATTRLATATATTTTGATTTTTAATTTTTTHYREDCPVQKFSFLSAQTNRIFCDNCVCYVCQKPSSQCRDWFVFGRQGLRGNHCNATVKSEKQSTLFWKSLRAKFSEMAKLASELAEIQQRVQALGPFEPGNEAAGKDQDLTQCRKCQWYNRFPNITPETMENLRRPTVFVNHWCRACGRVASENDFGKEQSKPYYSNQGDIFLGTKTISFSLHTHDPRQMSKFRKRWADNKCKPEWTFDETDMEEELFRHRLGKRPTLATILASIPVLPRDQIPLDGGLDQGAGYKVASASETQAIILDDTSDIVVLQEIQRNSVRFGGGPRYHLDPLGGDIVAHWDSEQRQGTLTIRVFVLGGHSDCPSNMTRFLGAWFGAFPFALSQVNGRLRAKDTRQFIGVSSSMKMIPIPPFIKTFQECSVDDDSITLTRSELIDTLNSSTKDLEASLTLEAGKESSVLGGVCFNETDFTGSLKRYFREILADVVHEKNMVDRVQTLWLEENLGVTSRHRRMRTYEIETDGVVDESIGGPKHGIEYDSYLSPRDYALAQRSLIGNASQVFLSTQSLSVLMDHMENLGHTSAPYVEGLTVELLPFQSQTVQWASEREETPGGIQAFLSTKLPPTSTVPDVDLYYNFVTGKISRDKPHLARGGIIAEQMGLGKTVISLALILRNPAPVLPESGILTSCIKAPSNASSETAFWDPDLYSRTSANKKKRGSIISRGTLVVCNVSLVGQWIDEARSKLEDPGLVYSYHGAGRKRDPHMLAQNSIVVTTYETLSSDATYHARKSTEGSDYTAPCEQVRWWRIICDESHVLRNASTKKTDAVLDLVGDNKWLVSGTPVNTSLNDLKNQLKFIGIQDVSAMFELFGRSTCKHTRDQAAMRGDRAFIPSVGHFTFLMRSIMMRHSQNQKYRGTSTTLMSLPPKTERTIIVKFSEGDQKEYETVETAAKEHYQEFKLSKGHELSKHYLALSQKLTPMRVACAGGKIPLNETGEADENEEVDEDGDGPNKIKTEKKFSDFAFRSKLDALVAELELIRTSSPNAKSLVFSQFASTLKWLQQELPEHGFQFRTLSGDMTMKKRARALSDFQKDPPTTIFLLSVRAGAVGINLTQANRVFIMEPCFNPALEAQAVGRVHRLGQTRNVEIIRLIMENSVESRMVQMLDKKYSRGAASNDSDEEIAQSDSEEGEDKKPADTSTVAMIGCLKSDKTVVMEDEFDLLFGVEPADMQL